jgi:hypothetical protein
MASSSSIRTARLTGSLRTIRFGAVAGWWRVQRGDLAKDAIIGVVVGVLLLLGAFWWDAKLVARQDALATAIADRQDGLARDLANQATKCVCAVTPTKKGGVRRMQVGGERAEAAESLGLRCPVVYP